MQTINVIENNGFFSCDIGVSKDEWLEILVAPTTQKEFVETLLRFYYMPEHKGSCTQVSRKQGGNARALNLYVSKFGNLVKTKLNRFEVTQRFLPFCQYRFSSIEGVFPPPK